MTPQREFDNRPGVVLFTLRPIEGASEFLTAAREMIEALGFEVLLEDSVGTALLCLDVFPNEVGEELRKQRPQLDDARTAKAELYVAKVAREQSPSSNQDTAMTSTENSATAWALAAERWPVDIDSARDIVEARHAALASDHVVVRDLSRWGHRSKVELVEHEGALAVKKTFREQALPQMEREIAFLNEFAPQRPDIVPVIARGTNYFIMPFVKSKPMARRMMMGVRLPHLLKLQHVRQVAELMRFLLARGIDPIDFVPHNLLIDEEDRIRAIDFEYAHRTGAPVEPEKAASLIGVGEDFPGDWPRTAVWVRVRPYENRWYPYTGLPMRSFLYDPPWLQRFRRSVFYPRFAVKKFGERLFKRRSAQVAGRGTAELDPSS